MQTQTKSSIHLSKKAIMQHELLHPKVQKLDFSKLRYKYTQSSEKEMTASEWIKAEQEYRRFLSLKCWYPDQALVPSKEVDKFWHAHILDTRAYREDCQFLFGQFMDHYPYFGIYGNEDYKMLVDAFEITKQTYEKHFGNWPYPNPVEAARCQDHACHAPSSCACRSSGACK